MKENSRELTEKFAETDRQMKETDRQMKETDRRLDKKFAETDREIKEIGKLLKQDHNLFTTQWGKLMESLVEGDLIKLLNQKGINIKDTCKNQVGEMRYTDEHGIEQAKPCEIDIIAKNGEEVVAVEVKTTLRSGGCQKVPGYFAKFHPVSTPIQRQEGVWSSRVSASESLLGDLCGKTGLVRD